jgi:hypothetical protein
MTICTTTNTTKCTITEQRRLHVANARPRARAPEAGVLAFDDDASAARVQLDERPKVLLERRELP